MDWMFRDCLSITVVISLYPSTTGLVRQLLIELWSGLFIFIQIMYWECVEERVKDRRVEINCLLGVLVLSWVLSLLHHVTENCLRSQLAVHLLLKLIFQVRSSLDFCCFFILLTL